MEGKLPIGFTCYDFPDSDLGTGKGNGVQEATLSLKS